MDWVYIPTVVNPDQLLTLASGSLSDEVLSNNARFNTPLMSVSYTHNDELTVGFQSTKESIS